MPQLKLILSAMILSAMILCAGGCVLPGQKAAVEPPSTNKPRAADVLIASIQYSDNPVVRVEAVEALEAVGGESAKPWIRSALLDSSPAVRFAASVAVGRLKDKITDATITRLTSDQNASVRLAAIFARHRLGHADRTGEITSYLFDHQDVTVRRNAALVLGLLGESGAIKVLARAMRDPDPGVRQHALEAMARLGSKEARQELTFMANTGVGSEEVFALTALMATGDCSLADTYRYKLGTADHLETKLVAARGLGVCGSDEGYETAIHALDVSKPARQERDDPAVDQMLRTHQLAAAALGAIGKREALPGLERALSASDDPRLQVSLARAVVEIESRPVSAAPVAAGRRQPR